MVFVKSLKTTRSTSCSCVQTFPKALEAPLPKTISFNLSKKLIERSISTKTPFRILESVPQYSTYYLIPSAKPCTPFGLQAPTLDQPHGQQEQHERIQRHTHEDQQQAAYCLGYLQHHSARLRLMYSRWHLDLHQVHVPHVYHSKRHYSHVALTLEDRTFTVPIL